MYEYYPCNIGCCHRICKFYLWVLIMAEGKGFWLARWVRRFRRRIRRLGSL